LARTGGLIGAWIQKRGRRWRLRKLGFPYSHLKSKEAFFTKMGELTTAKRPESISFISSSFKELPSHSWSEIPRYVCLRQEFESLGFACRGLYGLASMKLAGELWAQPDSFLSAGIFDSLLGGVHGEIMVTYSDDATVCFENTLDCGLRHAEHN
jgi:hypothetical protein